MVTHLPSVPSVQSCMCVMAALAAEAAEDRPRASMITAPRLPTLGMYSFLYQFSSTSLIADFPATVAKRISGYMVGEWLPHTVNFSTESTGLPTFLASMDLARLWSRRSIAVKLACGKFGADFMAIQALVLAGLPTTITRMSREAASFIAL